MGRSTQAADRTFTLQRVAMTRLEDAVESPDAENVKPAGTDVVIDDTSCSAAFAATSIALPRTAVPTCSCSAPAVMPLMLEAMLVMSTPMIVRGRSGRCRGVR